MTIEDKAKLNAAAFYLQIGRTPFTTMAWTTITHGNKWVSGDAVIEGKIYSRSWNMGPAATEADQDTARRVFTDEMSRISSL
jgi:hypothetical protein